MLKNIVAVLLIVMALAVAGCMGWWKGYIAATDRYQAIVKQEVCGEKVVLKTFSKR